MIAHVRDSLQVEYDEAGHGEPLVLLHAFPQTWRMWSRQSEELSRSFRVLTPNLRGFGASQRAASTWGVAGMAQDIADWLKYLNIESAVVGGLSMGGYVALALAKSHPQLIRGLILADTRADADSAEARTARETMIAFAREHTARDVFEKMAPRLFSEATLRERPALVEEAAAIAAEVSPQTIVQTLAALRDREDSRDFLPQFQIPTLVLVGEHDVISPPEHARQMAGALPNAAVQVLAGAGHFAHAESSREFNAAVRRWAASL
jgi:3-oxoadipate enol-lactonase